MNTFTVIGYYPCTNQRFAEMVVADTAQEAELKALHNNPELVVCGTVDGTAVMADTNSPHTRDADGVMG